MTLKNHVYGSNKSLLLLNGLRIMISFWAVFLQVLLSGEYGANCAVFHVEPVCLSRDGGDMQRS